MSLRLARIAAFPLLLFAAERAVAAAPPANDDAYTSGYVAAILEREFKMAKPAFDVRAGVVTVYAGDLTDVQQDKLATVLATVRGVTIVRVTEGEPDAPFPPAGALSAAPPSIPPLPAEETTVVVAKEEDKKAGIEFLPSGRLFDPLIADPRWPHFSAAYQHYVDDDEVKNAGAVSFGETFGLVGGPAPFDGRWQVAFQAGVFGLFDLDADSSDLINADYWVGIPVSYRRGDFSAITRVFHQSSHLGDEFLLRNRVDRVNLSYEGIDLLLSYDIGQGFRAYGGGGYLIHREPTDLDRWSTQVGAEYMAPFTMLEGLVRPVAAVDLQNREESNWKADLSVRAGVQFESREEISQSVQLLVEYFTGRNPNGQFYERSIEYIGLGAHVRF